MSEGAVRFQRTTTATGRLQLKAEVPCAWDTFPDRAGAVARTLGLTMIEAIDGPDCRLAIAGRGDAVFCISWDDWLDELTVIPWRDTSDGALEALLARATNDGPS